MKVSIVIPTYQCADLVGKTLTSIRMGGWDDVEVIVVDGVEGFADIEKGSVEGGVGVPFLILLAEEEEEVHLRDPELDVLAGGSLLPAQERILAPGSAFLRFEYP